MKLPSTRLLGSLSALIVLLLSVAGVQIPQQILDNATDFATGTKTVTSFEQILFMLFAVAFPLISWIKEKYRARLAKQGKLDRRTN